MDLEGTSMNDKANDYANRRLIALKAAGENGSLRDEIELAYNAGYLAGNTDAHRKEFIQEQATHFERGLS